MLRTNVDAIAYKIGGHFALTALIQKRIRELNAGAPPLVTDVDPNSRIELVIREIEQGKIFLGAALSPEEQAAAHAAAAARPQRRQQSRRNNDD
jgi:DNA-directed RNA polymerase subunit K/omega